MLSTGCRRAIGFTLCLGITALLCSLGCYRACDPCDCPMEHIARVDSLTFSPAMPCEGDTLTIRFWGILGGCTSVRFSHFETYRDSFLLDVTPWAEQPCGICMDMIIYLEGEPLKVSGLRAGDLTVVVRQENRPAHIETIEVLPCDRARSNKRMQPTSSGVTVAARGASASPRPAPTAPPFARG